MMEFLVAIIGLIQGASIIMISISGINLGRQVKELWHYTMLVDKRLSEALKEIEELKKGK